MAKRSYLPDNSMALTISQRSQLLILEEFIQRVRRNLGIPNKSGEYCHHAIDLLMIAYELREQIRTGEYNDDI